MLLAACSSSADLVVQSKEQFRKGNFYQAFYALQSARAAGYRSEELDRLYQPYRQAFLLKRAQRRVFDNEDALALQDLAQVLAVDPDNPIAVLWTRKAKEKLARRSTDRGDRAVANGDLEVGLLAYHEALEFVPGYPDAQDGISGVVATWQKRRDKAESRYLEGVRALAEDLFAQTEYHMLIALDADPEHEAAKRSKREAVERLHEIRFEKAVQAIESGHYNAALHDLEQVKRESPDYPGLDARIAEAEREIEAETLATKGERALFRGEYEKARESIDAAFELSRRERPRYNDLLLMTRDREYGDKYVVAKDAELQGRLEDAVARYRKIEEEYSGFLDVAARISDLQASIDLATEAYDAGAKAEEEGNLDQAIEKFADAALLYPKFRDVKARLEGLRQRRENEVNR
ncbi:MAG: hypothetical protein KDB80_06390 [Planctomycetes bacterium]|nr:hypothetical protein [Planctomycetota bacterium]